MIPKGYALIEFEMKLNRCAVSKKQIFFFFFKLYNYIKLYKFNYYYIIIKLYKVNFFYKSNKF